MKFPGVISLRKDLPIWADAERQLGARGFLHVVEIDEDALRRLRPQPDLIGGILDGPDERFEHEVEHARFGERGAVVGALRGVVDLVGAIAFVADVALNEGVGEVRRVAAGQPHCRILDDGAIETHDVIVLVDHRVPPRFFHVALQFDAERAVVPTRPDAAVYLARRENKTSPLGEETIVDRSDAVMISSNGTQLAVARGVSSITSLLTFP